MRRVLLACLLAGCGTAVDTTGLPSIDGYQSWGQPIELSTDIPGHPDSVREIYVNEVGRGYPHGGRYPLGTAIVKEIHERAGGAAGRLRYLAIMRKVGDDAGVPTNAGWLFTSTPQAGGDETQRDSCWETCHRSGPFDGAWLDYGR